MKRITSDAIDLAGLLAGFDGLDAYAVIVVIFVIVAAPLSALAYGGR